MGEIKWLANVQFATHFSLSQFLYKMFCNFKNKVGYKITPVLNYNY